MKVKDYVDLRFHFSLFRIVSARTKKRLFGTHSVEYSSKSQKKKLEKFLDWEVSSIEPFILIKNQFITLGIELSVPEFDGKQ